jgi:hypothetical protein
VRIARLLDRPPERLSFLEAVDPDGLRALREQLTDVLYDADRDTLERLARAGRLLPDHVLATVGERLLGPLLVARVAGTFDAERASRIGPLFPTRFLADVSCALDPRRASAVIRSLPAARVAEVALELERREEWVVMGAFLDHLSPEALTAVLDRFAEDSLLRIGPFVEAPERLDEVIAQLDEGRLVTLLRAADERGLWAQALELVDDLGPENRERLAGAALAEGDGLVEGLLRAAWREGLWDAVLPLLDDMDDAGRLRVAEVVGRQEPALVEAATAAAAERLGA